MSEKHSFVVNTWFQDILLAKAKETLTFYHGCIEFDEDLMQLPDENNQRFLLYWKYPGDEKDWECEAVPLVEVLRAVLSE
jgi:hypothetical protein